MLPRTLIALLLLLTACAAGKPPMFSNGTNWSIPVIGEGDVMLTPVFIGDKGPYLFALGPGLASAIDPRLVKELDLFNINTGQSLTDARDVVSTAQVRAAEVTGFRVGDLELRTHRLAILPQRGSYNGMPVLGMLGSTVFEDTAVWTIDRDRRMIYLSIQEQFTPPAAAPIDVRIRNAQMFVRADADDADLELQVDLVMPTTLLFPWAVEAAGLESAGGDTYTVKELEFKNGLVHRDLQVYKFLDKRIRENTLDGRLALDFFQDYRVTVNMHEGQIWLEERTDDEATLKDRITRWGAFLGCADSSCATASVATSEGSALLEVTRAPSGSDSAVEFVFAGYDENGERNDMLPPISVNMPAGVDAVRMGSSQLERYAGLELRLIEVTPFPSSCDSTTQGCARLAP